MRRIALGLVALVVLAGCADDVPVDSDGDGFSDDEEQKAGSDPQNATSVPTTPDVPEEEGNGTVPAWGDLTSATIRPGASLDGYCTFNFLFHGDNGSAYIGTAGHCTGDIGERVVLGGGGEIGTVVYDSDLVGQGSDFSLILLDEERIQDAHPQMLSWDGPSGSIGPADLSVGDVIRLHGYGVVLGQNDATRAREGVLVDWTEDEYDVDMPAVNGDSGSPLMHESGQAFGIVSRYGVTDGLPSTDSGPLMPFIFDGLAQAGYGDVVLATV